MSAPRIAIALPGVSRPRHQGGGHLNTLRFADLLARHAEVKLLSYDHREEDVWFLPEVEERLVREGWWLMLTWGPDVGAHAERYHGRLPLLYYQQSMDWGFRLPPDVPVISMSRHMAANAQRTWPASPQYYLPPVLPEECRNRGMERDLDVLVVARKQPGYVLDTLAPRLSAHCRVELLDRFVPRTELYTLFNRAKVYLYPFAPQKSPHTSSGWRLMEGISTQGLEAMACGCTVACDLRGGQADYLEPGVHGLRLMAHSPAWDVEQVLAAVGGHPQPDHALIERQLQEHYGADAFHRRAPQLLDSLARFFRFAETHPADDAHFRNPPPVSAWEKARRGIRRTLKGTRRSSQSEQRPQA